MTPSKTAILAVATNLAINCGLQKLTRDEVALSSGIATGTVNYHFGSMEGLREAVLRRAIERRTVPILGQYINQHVAHGVRIPKELRRSIARLVTA